MKLFQRKKKDAGDPQKALPSWLASGTGKIREKWVALLQRSTSRLTRQGWIAVLVVIILSGNGYGIYKILSAFDSPIERPSPGRISLPRDSAGERQPSFRSRPVQGVEFERIMRFKRHMDSLARSPTGRVTFDSITSRRPGLMDSLLLIEQYYSPTNK